jgi:hypothetical protein
MRSADDYVVLCHSDADINVICLVHPLEFIAPTINAIVFFLIFDFMGYGCMFGRKYFKWPLSDHNIESFMSMFHINYFVHRYQELLVFREKSFYSCIS